MNKTAPLEGIRVVDFTSMMAGPIATRLLADCGADVIKIETASGDFIRQRSPIRGQRSTYYGQMNGGKKSIVVDLKSAEGKSIALQLIEKADVVVENFRPGVMSSLGLGYKDVSVGNPGLVFCSISGFGQEGKRAGDPAYAPIIHAASGHDLAHMKYNPQLDRPATTGIFTADVNAAVYAFGAIQTALLHRERFGGGQHVDVTLIDTMLNLLVYEVQEAQFPVPIPRPLYKPLIALDGYVMIAPVNQKNFERMAIAVGRPEWNQDARFNTIGARERNWQTLLGLIEEWTLTRTARECEQTMMDVGVPCSRYVGVDELIRDPDMLERQTFSEVSDHSGVFLVPRQPFRLSNAIVDSASFVSDVGEDTDSILAKDLGYSEADIARLRKSGIIG